MPCACLGSPRLLSQNAPKEIGVRKVLGYVQNIYLLYQRTLKAGIIGYTDAIPVPMQSMHNWLQDLPYRIQLHWWIFMLAAFITIVIALFTVCLKLLRLIDNPGRRKTE